ncbi:hypothetical protein SLA2020_272990 [Shorea laevis]
MINPSRSSSPLYMLSCLVVLLLLPLPSIFADPDPLQDFCIADLSASIKEGNTSNTFGFNVTPANVDVFPGLNTLEVSLSRADFAIGGVIPPHTHPRATETVLVISGQVLVGFVTTGNVYYSKILTAGQIFVIPKGLVHFQRNVGPGKALFFTSFDSQLPGVAIVPLNLFATTPSIPNDVLTKSFQVGDDVVNSIKSKFGS